MLLLILISGQRQSLVGLPVWREMQEQYCTSAYHSVRGLWETFARKNSIWYLHSDSGIKLYSNELSVTYPNIQQSSSDTKLTFGSDWSLKMNTILVQNTSSFLSFHINNNNILIICFHSTKFEGTAEGICGLTTKKYLSDKASFQKYKLWHLLLWY